MATSVVPYNSILRRQKWIRDGMVEAANTAFWTFAMGTSEKSIIRNVKMDLAQDGHIVNFKYSGALEGKGFKNKETAYGKGESKKLFSDRVTITRWRFPVYNGDEWDATAIADLQSTQHSNSRSLLMDLWTKLKDQAIFDAMQFGATHRYIIDTPAQGQPTFTYDDLVKLEIALKSGNGFYEMATKTKAKRRFPVLPYKFDGQGKPMWLLVLDSYMLGTFFMDEKVQEVFKAGDVRGNGNRLISGALGTIRNFIIMDAGVFMGTSDEKTAPAIQGGLVDSLGYAQFNSTKIMASGLRTYKGVDKSFVPQSWEGDIVQTGAKVFSRGLVVGQMALQFAWGRQPDYKVQVSQDFGIDSESCLEVWCGLKPLKLIKENTDYVTAEAAGTSLGCVAVDLQLPDDVASLVTP